MARELTDGRLVFLSTLRAGRGERRLARTVVLVSAAIVLSAVPFAQMPLAQISAFIPTYESAFVTNDLITARPRRRRRPRQPRGAVRRRGRADPPRHGRPGRAPRDHAGEPLHPGDDPGPLEHLGVEPPRAGRSLVAPAARGARPVAHGRGVRVALRYRTRRGL